MRRSFRVPLASLALALALLSLGPVAASAQVNPLIPAQRPGTMPTPSPSPVRVTYSDAAPPGLETLWDGWINGERTNPPDPHGAAGPKGVIEITNRSVGYYIKSGSDAGYYWRVEGLPSFFAPGASFMGPLVDPRATYDTATGRFYLICLQTQLSPLTPIDSLRSSVYLAVSKSSHPATATPADWFLYRMDVTEIVSGTHYGIDYPGLAFDGQAIVVTGNMFTLPVTGFDFLHCRVIVVDKLQAIQGNLSWRSVATPNVGLGDLGSAFTLQPATVIGEAGPGDPTYLVEVPYYGPTTSLRLWALADPLGSPALSSVMVPIPDRGPSIEYAPQCENVGPLRTWSPVARGNVFWRDGLLWTCCTGSVGSPARSIVRYYAIRTAGFPAGSPTLAESGSFDGGPGVWTYQPAIGGNATGDVAIVYTQSDANTCPTTMYSARPAGATGFVPPAAMITSPVAKGAFLWGDYFAAAPDPIDDGFWLSGEIANAFGAGVDGNWSVEWAHIRFATNPGGWPGDGQAMRASQMHVADPAVVSDGAGGMIAAWNETRGGGWHLYAERLDTRGLRPAGWDPLGLVPFGNPPPVAPPDPPVALADGAGGAFLAWSGASNARLQRVTSGGAIASGWPQDGVLLGANPSLTPPRLVPDGAGGVIVVWEGASIRAQRVTGDAQALWISGGVPLGSGASRDVVADGAGGAIAVWAPPTVQRLSPDGAPQWTPGGVALADGEAPRIASDGAGGAIVCYLVVDDADGSYDVGAQHVTAGGEPAAGWPAGGFVVCAAGRDQTQPVLVSDAAGGAIIAWTDARSFPVSRHDVYALRLTGDGAVADGWSPGGIAICAAPGDQSSPAILADGVGGAVIAWEDRRAQPTCSSGACGEDVYVTRIHADGLFDGSVPAGGEPVATAAGRQLQPMLCPLASGSFGVAWADGRFTADCIPFCTSSVYAQKLAFDVTPPAAPVSLAVDVGRHTALATWRATGDDGDTGNADRFELRYSTTPITAASFPSIPDRVSGPVSVPPGVPLCTDIPGLEPCTTYYFAVRMRDVAGNWSPIGNVAARATLCAGETEVACGAGAVGVPTDGPDVLGLAPPSPNPAADAVTIRFSVPPSLAGHPLKLGVFDLAGRRVRSLSAGVATAGPTSVAWDLHDDSGGHLRPGRYYVRLTVADTRLTRSLIVR